ncbi:MAG: MMPL family transporter [Nanobdellota archaeon]
MNEKIKKLLTNWRFLLFAFFLLISIFLISFIPGREGVAIRGIEEGSPADGIIPTPPSDIKPMGREVIKALNGNKISNVSDYYDMTNSLKINDTLIVKTNENTYTLEIGPKINRTPLNKTKEVTYEYFNETLNKTVNGTKEVQQFNKTVIGPEKPGIMVYDAPATNIRKGLDLQGGTRVIVEPVKNITDEDYNLIKRNLEQRLNVFGLSDVTISIAKNFQMQPEHIVIEIAGSTVQDISDLVLSQGKFEAKVANNTVFTGSSEDVAFVGRGPQDSRIEGCNKVESGQVCSFSFQLKLTEKAARSMADSTEELEVVPSEDGSKNYLSKDIQLYLDNKKVDSLKISAKLKGKPVTDIMISGSGAGKDYGSAYENATKSMKNLQTIIETGSLPSKLKIVKSDIISPTLGKDFTQNAIKVGLIALLAVLTILFINYRKISVIIPIGIALMSEVIIILGAYSAFNWTLDLAGIAGIIIVLGTGVDHLVVITNEISNKDSNDHKNWKQMVKGAFSIILGAFLTTTFAMFPLLLAGAGLLRGFAITTLTGLFVGVLIVRPCYAKVLELFKI